MAAEQRRLLEQLMGESALASVPAPRSQLAITDPKLCRSYLCGTCPHDLFTNTKQDIGPCPKVHSESHRTEYQDASAEQKRKWAFEYDYLRDMGKYVGECDRRIEGAQRRLEKTPDEIRKTNALVSQIGDAGATMAALLEEMQVLCSPEVASVNLAASEFYKLRTLHHTRAQLQGELRAISDTSGPSGHQKLQVCDVCGAYLSRLDNDRRLADHFYGKMHLGYAQMRKTYDALQKELKTRGPAPRPAVDEGADGRDGYRGGEYGGGYGGRGRGGGYGGRGGYRGGRGGGGGRW